MAGVAPAENDRYGDDRGADFDENFAAVEPVDAMMLEVGVGEERVPEEGHGAEIDREVESFPKAAAELDARIGSDDHERDDVKGDGADGVFERLLRRMDGIDDIEDAKFWGFVKEQDDRMRGREEKSEVAGPVVQRKIIEAAMRPAADGAVAENHQHAEKHVDGDSADGDKAEIGGEIEECDVHRKNALTVPSRKSSIIQPKSCFRVPKLPARH